MATGFLVTQRNDQPIPTALSSAIEGLYNTFSRYGLPRESSYSTHTNITEDDVARLRATPLRTLPPQDLAKFSFKALNTWGDEDEFRHYLPRMLELAVLVPNWTPLASLLGKLDTGRWTEWPPAEQQAIIRFVIELWNWVIGDERARVSAVDLLLGASNAGIPLAPLMERWEQAAGLTAVRHLGSLINQEQDALIASGSLGRRWSAEARRAFGELTRSSAIRQRLETAFFESGDPETSDSVSRALAILDRIPASTT